MRTFSPPHPALFAACWTYMIMLQVYTPEYIYASRRQNPRPHSWRDVFFYLYEVIYTLHDVVDIYRQVVQESAESFSR